MDEWFAGRFTSSRLETTEAGIRIRSSCVMYEAVPERWAAQHRWHDLAVERWRRAPAA